MFCYNCGKNIAEGQRFCTNCGAKIPTPQSADAQIKEAEMLRIEQDARRQAEMAQAEEARRQEELEYLRRQEQARRQAEEARRAEEYRQMAEAEYLRQRESRVRELENQYRDQYIYNINKERDVEKYRSQAITSMILGIISLATLGIAGWVLAIIAKNKALPIIEEYEGTSIYGFAKTGWITGRVGLTLSVIFTVFYTIYLTIYMLAMSGSGMVY